MCCKKFHLAIDSTYNLTIALFQEQDLIAKFYLAKDNNRLKGNKVNASDILLPEIAKLLANHKIKMQDLAFISIINGPGFFTGVRIAIIFAKMVNLALNIPVIQYSSCKILAYEALQQQKQAKSLLACYHIGKQGMVYAMFDNNCNYLQEETYMAQEQIAEFVKSLKQEELIVVGNKQYLVENTKILNNSSFLPNILYPNIQILGELAINNYTNKNYSHNIVPLYAKETDITTKEV
ncbi:tRNA N6-adenosine threonylcarbamoyltransferase [Candidatus Hepatincola sp. Pdp]